jgi:hypothetical protein
MGKIISKSFSMVNKNLKELLTFFGLLTFIIFVASILIPGLGTIFSIAVSYYAYQEMLRFVQSGEFNIKNLKEANIKGICKAYGFSLLLIIPCAIVVLLSSAFLVKDILSLGFNSINYSGYESVFYSFAFIIVKFILFIFAGFLALNLIFPFTKLLYLDEDFKDNNFFSNISISLEIAKGMRFKVFLAMCFNLLLCFLSIFTLGLALIYIQPLYMIVYSNLYEEGKKKNGYCNELDSIKMSSNYQNSEYFNSSYDEVEELYPEDVYMEYDKNSNTFDDF